MKCLIQDGLGVFEASSEKAGLPGGDHVAGSGTSGAAPQVTNLAAKLFAKYPGPTVVQVKELIVDSAD